MTRYQVLWNGAWDPVVLPERPDWLCEAAAREWDRVAPYLFKAGFMTALCSPALALYCTVSVRVDKTKSELHGEKDPARREELAKTLDGLEIELYAWAKSFGLTPASFAAIKEALVIVTDEED